MQRFILIFAIVALSLVRPALAAPQAEPWQAPYASSDATGDHVIAFWNFEGEGDAVADASGHGHDGTLRGATRNPEGRFGAGLEAAAGWPVEDVLHALRVPDATALSPRGAFTAEMWIRPSAAFEGYPESFLLDKKYVAHDDFQWILEAPDASGKRRMRVALGFGADTELWWSAEGLAYAPDTWYHIAFTYDGAGTVAFLRDGRFLGGATKPGRGAVNPGSQELSIGDRVGSLYHGFPGTIDEVRLTEGVREFRPVRLAATHLRAAWQRMEKDATLSFTLTNTRTETLQGLIATVRIGETAGKEWVVPDLAPGSTYELKAELDTTMRPGDYAVAVAYRIGEGEGAYENSETFPVTIVPRQPPHRMPVVMWGVGGVEGVIENLPRLKDLGFTHVLGLRCNYEAIWNAGKPVPAQSEVDLAASYRMLDQAFAEDLGVIISLDIGHWLDGKSEFHRRDLEGKPYERVNPCCLTPGLVEFSENVGKSAAQSYGAFPAFQAALINSEVRDGSEVCFHDHDHAAYRNATGLEIPDGVRTKNGVSWTELPDFPVDRVVPDDYDLLQYYRWFWKVGDGWNAMQTAAHEGLQTAGRDDFWTFFDPAVRVPSIWGSGGAVDAISHWTYSYPDPIRIGLTTDELLAMAQGAPGQDVMKMTQIIWYRSQTAPVSDAQAAPQSAWEDYDPDAAYITIAPNHLREAFWTKISRPIKGIMYHGWQSLVPTEGGSVYRYTHPETAKALKELMDTVVKPLGPTLVQVPAAKTDVALLQSFTSQMFAGRGTYGWGSYWSGDAHHILQYAGLQPEIIYEETLLQRGLDGFRVLVMADCDALTASVVEKVRAFQQAGGIVVGDEHLCPAIQSDVMLPVYTRSGKADIDKTELQARALALREDLGDRHTRYVESSEQDVITHRRAYGTSDYIFAINDRREFGTYVGAHGMVMENGLPASARIGVARPNANFYDLVAGREITSVRDGARSAIDVQAEPGGGRVYLVTEQPIAEVKLHGAESAKPGEAYALNVSILGGDGSPVNAIIPVELDIRDPDGRRAELSGHYGAKDGALQVTLNLASNDTLGVWTIRAREGASGKEVRHFFRLAE